jgi:hypothetical protein
VKGHEETINLDANDGSGDTGMGRGLYSRSPDLRLAATQNLQDHELFYIIENGIRLTGMPAWVLAKKPARRKAGASSTSFAICLISRLKTSSRWKA